MSRKQQVVIASMALGSGDSVGTITAGSKKFSTGSQGFFGQGKLVIGGLKYQTMVTLVLTHSKPGDNKTPGS